MTAKNLFLPLNAAKTKFTISRHSIYKCAILFSALTVLAVSTPVVAAEEISNAPVDLQADSLHHDEINNTVTASGDVIMIQDGRTLKADKIVYNLTTDTAKAVGNVEFTDSNGDRHEAEQVTFNNAMKDGFVEGLKTFLVDGSRFTADEGEHKRGNETVMHNATYTPCETCESDPEDLPLWQIRASEVTHDKQDKTVSYRNARFEWMGVPIGYLPYFSHPDGTVKRKSGFLTPSAGFKSDLGFFVESSYYWSISPDKDATIGLMALTKQAPVALGEYRQRWSNAELKIEGSATYSDYYDSEGGESLRQDNELRGHLFAESLWNINNKWRAGLNLELASDDQYLNQYDFDSEDVLENELYLERFSGRNYASARLLAFQDLRVDDDDSIFSNVEQPDVLPEIQASFLGEPGQVPLIGGRWSADVSALGLRREADNGQDLGRLGMSVGWYRRLISDFGLVTDLDAQFRSEYYGTRDGDDFEDADETRSFAFFNGETSYPVIKRFEKFQWTIEPTASLTLAPNIDQDDDIPNEDSQDVQIDALNLFEPNRFPGLDRVEDSSHVTYGLRTGIYGHDGSYGDVFFGQSQRFSDDDNPFAAGTGLDEKQSDFVGQISGNYQNNYRLDYRFQLDNNNMSPQRHEVDATVSLERVSLSTRYLFAKSLEGSDIEETREQIENSASYYINDKWRLNGSARHDLGEDPGLREARLGVDYIGQCFSWSVMGRRILTQDTSGDNGTEILLRIGLKNLGEFETGGLSIGKSSSSSDNLESEEAE